jgi:hypothetical protein
MKKLFAFVLVISMSLTAFSQLRFGIKAGAETTTVPTYNITTGVNNIEALKDAAWGYHVGAFMRVSIAAFFIQPEVVFASNTFDYNVTTVSGTQLEQQKFDRLSVPVLFGFKIGPLRLNAGPAASFQIGSPGTLIDDPDFSNMYKNAVYGYQAGIGLDLFKRLTLDARYAGPFSDEFGDTVEIGDQSFNLDYGQSSFLLSIGIMF